MARLERFATYISVLMEPHDRLLELGRQSQDDPAPLAVVPNASPVRLVIAARDQNEIGRKQLRIEALGSQRVRVTNINERNTVAIVNERQLNPGDSYEGELPVRLTRGGFQLCIEAVGGRKALAPEQHDLFQSFAHTPPKPQSLSQLTRSRVDPPTSVPPARESFVASLQSSNADVMLDRLEQLVAVLQQVASTTEFSKQIAEKTLEMVNLDRAAVLKRTGDLWEVVAVATEGQNEGAERWQPSQKLLTQLLRDRRTLWGRPGAIDAQHSESLAFLRAMVAAPILDPDGVVIGAVYGDRRLGGSTSRPPIDRFDAKLVEILACGVAGGWARVEQERAAIEKRIQFERFVTKEVAQSLEEDPEALVGRDADVTLLFCDIAGFSRISGLLNPTETFRWINAVMETLSQCVLSTRGTLIDYVGDELIAMWGAPLAMEDHAAAATETALLMLDALKEFNERYVLPDKETTQIGIGINTGVVRVGNTGSEHKLKYGPLGAHVNIASRVQGATRFLRTPALMTGDTARRLEGKVQTRRLCSVRLKNIEIPVDLFELVAHPGPGWREFAADYEQALLAWEQHDLQAAIGILSRLVTKSSQDGPTMVLLSRAVDAWSRDQREYDPVWTLASK
ncbi:adenylate/guanylate cyclase domain-containing protein [Schlesneria sp.]|uniref:adenylate/guanylate cyclase domain-containing protein n=1 Tax=Schlesneria sp. TaxID=2762018 RepID=UPI002F061BDB